MSVLKAAISVMSGTRRSFIKPEFVTARKAAARHLDWRYQAIYEFLQISPSYLAAHELATLGKTEFEPLPSDFDKVENVYSRLGSVWGTSFHSWWFDRGQYEFGRKTPAQIQTIGSVNGLELPSAAAQAIMTRRLEKSLTVQRDIVGLPQTLVLAIPLRGSSKELLRSLSAMIKGFEFEPDQVGSYNLVKSKAQQFAVLKSLQVVRRRASTPKNSIWKLAERVEVGGAILSRIRQSGSARASANEKNVLSAQMSRYTKRAYVLAENAARGSFPDDTPLPQDVTARGFNYAVLNRVYRREIRSLERQLKKAKQKLAVKKAKRSST